MNERDTVKFESGEQFSEWLELFHASSDGIWVEIAKKGSREIRISYADAVECALCYGWIDGKKQTVNSEIWVQYFCRRNRRSIWSDLNRQRVARLTEEGRMRAPGLLAVEEAKANGRWESAYAAASQGVVPELLQEALNARPDLASLFESLSNSRQFALTLPIVTAVQEKTKIRRVESVLATLTDMLQQKNGSHV